MPLRVGQIRAKNTQSGVVMGSCEAVRSAVEAARSGVEWTPPDLDALHRSKLKAELRRITDDDMLVALTSVWRCRKK